MNARRLLILAGSVWDFARFFLVLLILATLFDVAGGWGTAVIPWLLVGASSGLLVPVGGFLLSVYPERHANLVGLLRLGKLLNIFSLVLIPISGTADIGAGAPLLRVGAYALTPTVAIPLVMFLDLIFLGALISFRAGTT